MFFPTFLQSLEHLVDGIADGSTGQLDDDGRPKIARRGKKRRRGDIQLTLFAPMEHPLLDVIRQADVNSMTPLEALAALKAWQDELGEE